jgi:hypothetical protein
VLFSTKLGSVSYEDDELHNGVFAHFVVEGFRGAAAGADGLITFRDLTDYVTDAVRQYSFQKGHLQIPFEGVSEAVDDFLLARTAPAPLPAPSGTTETREPSGGTVSRIEPPVQPQAEEPLNRPRYDGSRIREDRYSPTDIKHAMMPHPTLANDLDVIIKLADESRLKTIKAMNGHWANEQYGWYYSSANLANASRCHVIRDSHVTGGLRFSCRWFMEPKKEVAQTAYLQVLEETSSAILKKYPSATTKSSEKSTEFHLPTGVVVTLMLGSDPPGVTLVRGAEDLILMISPRASKSGRRP